MLNEEEFPSNSKKDREQKTNYSAKKALNSRAVDKPEVEKIISGTAKIRKKSLGAKIAETFTGDDARSVGDYLLFDVIIPATKNMIADMFSQGVERLLFGTVRGSRVNNPSRTNYTSYSSRYSNSRPTGRAGAPDGPRFISNRARSQHDFDEICLDSRSEAEQVLVVLTENIERYDSATVADLYDLVGITGNFTDIQWGWYAEHIPAFSVSRVRDGYLLNLPAPEKIE